MDRFSKTLLEETYRLAHSKGPHSKTSWLCTLQKITLPYNDRSSTLAVRGLEEPQNSQELLTKSVDLTKFVGPLPFST